MKRVVCTLALVALSFGCIWAVALTGYQPNSWQTLGVPSEKQRDKAQGTKELQPGFFERHLSPIKDARGRSRPHRLPNGTNGQKQTNAAWRTEVEPEKAYSTTRTFSSELKRRLLSVATMISVL